MSVRTIATSIAALSLVGVAVVAPATIAHAQESSDCVVGNGYAPQGQGQGVSDGTATRGQEISASSGCAQFAPGREVAFGVESTYQQLGTTTANAGGAANATFTVPQNLSNGRHHVVFTGPAFNGQGTNTVRVPFTVVADAAGRAALPVTGSDELIALAIGGSALVALGAGMVVVARRRREGMPSGLA